MPAASAPLIPGQSALCAAPSRQIPADGPKGRETAPAPGFRRKHKRRCRDITAQHRLNSMRTHSLSSASGLAKGAGSGYNKPVVQFMLAALRVVHSYRAAKFMILFPF